MWMKCRRRSFGIVLSSVRRASRRDTDFQYANAGYTLLSQIVERVSGQSFEDFLRARIFVPMRHSGYRQGEAEAIAEAIIASLRAVQ